MKDEVKRGGVQTKVIHTSAGLNETSAVNAPIWQTATFRAGSSEHFAELAKATRPTEFYTRYGNPTLRQAEETLAALEGGEAALVTASGMGAIFTAVMSLVRAGDHVVAQRNLYAGTSTLLEEMLPRWGAECTFVEQSDAEAFAAAMRPDTKIVYAETPSNPLMRLTDLRAVAEAARRHGAVSMVDNTIATPVNQRPLELGFDLSLHSATKFLSGHHDVTAGAVVGSRELVERAWKFAVVAGASLSPFEGWLLLRGMRTLGLRVEGHNRNAHALARFLEAHPKVERVHYPGLESHPQHQLARRQMSGYTGVLSVELRGGYAAAETFIKSLRLATYAASLGGFETLVVRPAAMWAMQLTPDKQRELGIAPGLVRVSVGLEDQKDLLADFAQALDEVK